jgi:hypothetical protein
MLRMVKRGRRATYHEFSGLLFLGHRPELFRMLRHVLI